MPRHKIFITGGTGYIGQRLIPLLVKRGHSIRALVRPESEAKLPSGCAPVSGNALDQASFEQKIQPADTFIQLVGVSHPSPSKAGQFRAIDLLSVQASVAAAVQAGIDHFIYISVAHPARMMKAYIEVRVEGETLIRNTNLNATILRPWYVLGPGHRWPILLVPIYKILECIPATRAAARRLGLVTIDQMLSALVQAVEKPGPGIRVMEVPEIRQTKLQ
jgi:uncharacterized protein YbjT (DUF2867 family)